MVRLPHDPFVFRRYKSGYWAKAARAAFDGAIRTLAHPGDVCILPSSCPGCRPVRQTALCRCRATRNNMAFCGNGAGVDIVQTNPAGTTTVCPSLGKRSVGRSGREIVVVNVNLLSGGKRGRKGYGEGGASLPSGRCVGRVLNGMRSSSIKLTTSWREFLD